MELKNVLQGPQRSRKLACAHVQLSDMNHEGDMKSQKAEHLTDYLNMLGRGRQCQLRA